MPRGVYLRTEEIKKNLRLNRLGKKHSKETREKMRKACCGERSYRWKGGKPKCMDCKTQLAGYYSKRCPNCFYKKNTGSNHWNYKNVGYKAGEKHYLWIKDRSLIKKQEDRNNPNDKQWKRQVWQRDNFKCKIANQDCSGRIEAHHILGWTEYPELRYEINNGITLCHAHHPRKRAEEKRLAPFFTGIVENTKV